MIQNNNRMVITIAKEGVIMAYYCGECIVWRGSRDENRYGERWCSYSRRYERSDQNTYGCQGFIYAGRAILTKVCEILELDKTEWFAAFDEVKNDYIMPDKVDWLVEYCSIGPRIAEQMEKDAEGKNTAQMIMEKYLLPAKEKAQKRQYEEASELYQMMVSVLQERYFL